MSQGNAQDREIIQKLRADHKRYLLDIITGKRPGDVPKAKVKLAQIEQQGEIKS